MLQVGVEQERILFLFIRQTVSTQLVSHGDDAGFDSHWTAVIGFVMHFDALDDQSGNALFFPQRNADVDMRNTQFFGLHHDDIALLGLRDLANRHVGVGNHLGDHQPTDVV